MKQQLLLLQDVDALGKKGEIVTARPGYVRNFLLPKGFAVVANANTIRKQERLQAERLKQAVIDRQASEELSIQIEGSTLEVRVKVDPEGHMYGSVSAGDIAKLFEEKSLPVDKKSILVTKPIKETGSHKIVVKLKEGVTANFLLNIIPEGVNVVGLEAVTAPIPVEQEAGKSE